MEICSGNLLVFFFFFNQTMNRLFFFEPNYLNSVTLFRMLLIFFKIFSKPYLVLS